MDPRFGWEMPLAALLLAFALSTAIAWVYVTTHHGLTYVRGFAHTLSLGGVVAALVMLAIGDDVARGLGLVGALALIRLRSSIKDPRDLIFAFASLGIGASCGVFAFNAAVLGMIIFGLAAFWLSSSPFGSRRRFDGMLRLRLGGDDSSRRKLESILGEYCKHFSLLQLREVAGGNEEHSYHVKLRKADSRSQLVRALGGVPQLAGVSLMMQDMDLEI